MTSVMKAAWICSSILCWLFVSVQCKDETKIRPLIIAHRGSSGMRPEHTIDGYQLAIDQGADIIECDVVVTKDLALICSHDLYLNETTDVADHPEFASRLRTYDIPEEGNITNWFTIDFTLAEIKTLRKRQRIGRDPSFDGKFQIPTFEEYIKVAQNANRTVGIYPETKSPEWFNTVFAKKCFRMEDAFIKTLREYGYTERDDPCFVQSFSEESIRYMSTKTNLRLIMLLEKDIPLEKIKDLSKICYGLGPWKNQIIPQWTKENKYANSLGKPTDFIKIAHEHGLKVHPYTFRNEREQLPWDFGLDPYAEYELYVKLGVDGLFTDFTKSLSNYFNLTFGPNASSGLKPLHKTHVVNCFFEQCGGKNWNGSSSCQVGSSCQRLSEWYSQCLPIGEGYHQCANDSECLEGWSCQSATPTYGQCRPLPCKSATR